MSNRAKFRNRDRRLQQERSAANRAANPEKYARDPNERQMGRAAAKRRQEAAKKKVGKVEEKNKEKNQQKNLTEITKRPPKKGAPESLPKNLRYPFSAIDNTMDFIKFTVCKYKRNQNKSEGDNTSSYVTRDDKDLMGTILGDIILPIPAQLSDTNTANYGPSNMNFMQEAGMEAAQALLTQGGTDKAGKSINEIILKQQVNTK